MVRVRVRVRLGVEVEGRMRVRATQEASRGKPVDAVNAFEHGQSSHVGSCQPQNVTNLTSEFNVSIIE